MIWIPSFIKIGSGIQELKGGGGIQTYRPHKSIFVFFKKESRLKRSKQQSYISIVTMVRRRISKVIR
jgi:hypothetical protein